MLFSRKSQAMLCSHKHGCLSDSATPCTVTCQAPLSMGFSKQRSWSGLPCPPPGDLPNLGIKPRSSALQVNSLLSKPPGKPMNIGVGSLSLLQGIFLTQELNWGLLHCKQILYQLSYQGSLLYLNIHQINQCFMVSADNVTDTICRSDFLLFYQFNHLNS